MPHVTYIEHDGTNHEVEVASGMTLMEAALHYGVPGIAADCGGQLICATCQIYVDPAWKDTIGIPGEIEEALLELAPEVHDNSRLSCQVKVTEALDGLIVHLPERQH